jgi:hypothetical protein
VMEADTLVTEVCCSCGLRFAFPASFQKQRKEDRRTFHCPNGHSQSYTGKTEAEKLREELESEKRRHEYASAEVERLKEIRIHIERQHAAAKGRITKLKNSVAAGTCPCCKKYVPMLYAHMKTQHAGYAKKEEATE